jgi:hypothetical protein
MAPVPAFTKRQQMLSPHILWREAGDALRAARVFQYASGEGHRGGGRAHANGLAQNARSGQLVYDQGIRQLQRLAAAGANSKAGDR